MKQILIFWAFMMITIIGCQSDKKPKNDLQKNIPVKVTRIERSELSLPIRSVGILSAKEESKLSFKTGGIIHELLVDEGEFVSKGKLLASLKPDEIQAMAAQARSAFQKAERDFQRAQNLYADSVVTLEQIQDVQTGLEIAKAQLEIANFNVQHSQIVAPSDGKILKRRVERNELIGPGYPVYLFGSGRKDWVLKVGLTDRDVMRCQLNDSAIVEFDACPNQVFAAKIREIAGAADPMSGLFEVQLKLTQSNTPLITGFIGKITIFPSDRKMVSIVPMVALVNSNNHQGDIFIIQDSLAVQMPVTVSFLMENQVALSESLKDIEFVVTEGAAYLKPGSSVEIINE